MQTETVSLVAFYNAKALGVRYLESALQRAGYHVNTIFFKSFHSVCPTPCTERELDLLCEELKKHRPVMIGLSVMSSMYLDTVRAVMTRLQKEQIATVVCGGAFASMYPQKLLEYGASYVIRSDGERAVCRLAQAISKGEDPTTIPSLTYEKQGVLYRNPIADVALDLDEYGIPAVECMDACLIEHDTVRAGDPQLNTRSYEVIASRGCPFRCSYCCSGNLADMLPDGFPRVRYRSVESVIAELKEAKAKLKHLIYIHFYDEVFPVKNGWIDRFTAMYRQEIRLPFAIWSHPKACSPQTLQKLKKAGLQEVIMGIQSGCEEIRRQVFHRYETQQEIIDATVNIREAGIFWSSYDFMLRHPFESAAQIRETYDLVLQLRRPFELQLHGLNFLPGSDIVSMAIEQGIMTADEMEQSMFAPMEVQFGSYWQHQDTESDLWYELIYCLQFDSMVKKAKQYAQSPAENADAIHSMYRYAQKRYRVRYLYRKIMIVLRSRLMRWHIL